MASRRVSPADQVAGYREKSPIWASLFKVESGRFVEENVRALAQLFDVKYVEGRPGLSADTVFYKMLEHTLPDPDFMELDGFSDGNRPISIPKKTWKVTYKNAGLDWTFDYSEYFIYSNKFTVGGGRELDFPTMAKIACAYLWIGEHPNLPRFKGVTKRGILMYPTEEMRSLDSYGGGSVRYDAFVKVKPLAIQVFNAIFHLNDRGVSDVFRRERVFVGKVIAPYTSDHVPYNELPDPKVLLVPDFVDADKKGTVTFASPTPLSVLFPENASNGISKEDYESAAYSIPGWDHDARKELRDALTPYFEDEEKFRQKAPAILKALSEPRDPYNPDGDELPLMPKQIFLETRNPYYSDDDSAPALKRARTAAAAAAAALVRTRGDVAAAVELLRL